VAFSSDKDPLSQIEHLGSYGDYFEQAHRVIDTVVYTVGQQSQTLHREHRVTDYVRPWVDGYSQPPTIPENLHILSGYTKRVRVLTSAKGRKHLHAQHLLYYGPLVDLTFDPKMYEWSDGTPLLEYTAKLGRSLLQNRVRQRNLATTKWPGILPATFQSVG
jgi:hypothetical protein